MTDKRNETAPPPMVDVALTGTGGSVAYYRGPNGRSQVQDMIAEYTDKLRAQIMLTLQMIVDNGLHRMPPNRVRVMRHTEGDNLWEVRVQGCRLYGVVEAGCLILLRGWEKQYRSRGTEHDAIRWAQQSRAEYESRKAGRDKKERSR